VKIILARPRGFCAGVNMAVNALELALDRFGAPLFVYHEIVHNRHIVERFRTRGVIFVDDLDDVPSGWALDDPASPGYPAAVRDWARRRGIAQGLCGLDLPAGRWTPGLPP